MISTSYNAQSSDWCWLYERAQELNCLLGPPAPVAITQRASPYVLLPFLSFCPAPGRETGYCFRPISLFISLFVSSSATLRENGWTDLHEIFREVWSDHGTTWLNLGSIRVNGSAGQRSISLLFGLIVVFWQSCAAT